MAQGGRGGPALTVCRAGGVLALTGGLTAPAAMPYAAALALTGFVLLAVGGWMISRQGTRR